ncbi:hypothetical protein Pla22_28020 [Rubripirellula amarantea]|uniref:Uncharacterized protein n=1 Tax=Rubripirellula amarantea TaxID=2527999 RepID=A0A5C5WX16_9BACT|nr:hypothetical protein [Rubripirellula amarantea]TWT55148.1 hypothetical protein Pla22_28020 [Rubripirellula amarantea]
MNRNRTLLAASLSLVLLTVVFSARGESAPQNAAPIHQELFDGKIVTVYMNDPVKGSGQVMQEVRLEKIGDRWMLLGTAVSTGQEGEWDDGLITGFSWEAVTAFYVFTQEQFDEKMEAARS